MTKRDQVLRSWIERDHPRHPWQSCISYRRKVHRKSTHSRIRKAALQFNVLHLTEVLFPNDTAAHTPPHQPDLFHDPLHHS